jgi:DNA repair protein RadC
MKTGSKANHDEPCPLCFKPVVGGPLISSDDAMACLEHFRNKRQEFFICLTLDGSARLINQRVITIGLLDMAVAHPREVFSGALTDLAASIIIAHNHPSGEARPSSEDIKTTQKLVSAGVVLGMPIRDHIIIGKKDHFSFRERGLIEWYEAPNKSYNPDMKLRSTSP